MPGKYHILFNGGRMTSTTLSHKVNLVAKKIYLQKK